MKILDWGLVPYEEASRRQLELVEKVLIGSSKNTIVFCKHPPVVTVGRGTKPGDIFGWRGATLETSRGGRATYHGPSQVVAYPILNLDQDFAEMRPRDLHAYMRVLETAMVQTLAEFGVKSEARTVKFDDGSPSLTGVWVGEKKIASIGIAVKKWVTYHGLAINVAHDDQAFTGINPCGFRSEIMTCMEDVLGTAVLPNQVQATLASILLNSFRRA